MNELCLTGILGNALTEDAQGTAIALREDNVVSRSISGDELIRRGVSFQTSDVSAHATLERNGNSQSIMYLEASYGDMGKWKRIAIFNGDSGYFRFTPVAGEKYRFRLDDKVGDNSTGAVWRYAVGG